MGRPPGVVKKTVYKKAASAPASQPTQANIESQGPVFVLPAINKTKPFDVKKAIGVASNITKGMKYTKGKPKKSTTNKTTGSHKPGRPPGTKTQRLPCGCPKSCRSCKHNNCR